MHSKILTATVCAFWLLCAPFQTRPATTISSVSRNAYGGNIGWTDWYVDGLNGVVIGEYVCSGYIYAANVGWINVGSGNPTNGVYYQNLSANDFGVNQDGLGNLRGYGWGANIGWVDFESNGAPAINLFTGRLSGYIWSANCGWIGLSNAVAYVQTDSLYPGALAPDGLPIPWLLTYFGTTNVNATADPTQKGMTIGQDYLAGTDPNDSNSVLRITAESFTVGGTNDSLTWDSVPTRLYHVQENVSLSQPAWFDSGVGPIAAAGGHSTTISFSETNNAKRFYRIQAVIPLSPVH
jgi:hypothetical protein